MDRSCPQKADGSFFARRQRAVCRQWDVSQNRLRKSKKYNRFARKWQI